MTSLNPQNLYQITFLSVDFLNYKILKPSGAKFYLWYFSKKFLVLTLLLNNWTEKKKLRIYKQINIKYRPLLTEIFSATAIVMNFNTSRPW